MIPVWADWIKETMESKTREFKRNLPEHLGNRQMRTNIAKATWLSMNKRAKVVSEIEDWEGLREQAYHIKKDIVDNLWEHLDTFQKNAETRGIVVHRARDAKEANAIAETIAREHKVKLIVKSKSMLTEEIEFNPYMIGKGFEVVETDLGEYILQLADQAPSHLTGPAVHLSKIEIAKIFQEKLGIPYSEDPTHLTKTARDLLREKFLQADMGVTGANFGMVENGSIAVVENEGNARMCMYLPPVHVAFMGIERMIHRIDELSIFLTLLCRSATGQKMTSFISVSDGPRREGYYDGPKHVHYILVDNKRSGLLDEPHLKEALHCIRCGACYNTCPVYQNIGGHAYGWVYQGPIGAVITPHLRGLEETRDLPFASSLCGSCSEVCPVKIPLHHMLLHQRNKVVEAGLAPRMEKLAMKGFVKVNQSPQRLGNVANLGKHLQRLMGSRLPVPGWTSSREFPQMAKTTFQEWWKKETKKDD